MRGRSWRWPRLRLRPMVVVALIAFVNMAAWALIVPNFEGPDEASHTGYAVYLAETGRTPRDDLPRAFASSEVIQFANAIQTFDWLQFAPYTRPPWIKAQERAYQREVAAHPANRKDGGGFSSASVHGPVYYLFPAAAYRVFYHSSFPSRMFVMRLMSALLGALTVGFIYLTVQELVPRRRWAAIAAALLAAFQPMFSFISGMVNADVGVNLAGAALIYLLVRALRRGLTLWVGVGISAAFVLGVLAKATMLAFVPPLGFALLVLLWRRSGRLVDWAAMAGTFVGLAVVWGLIAHGLHHSFVPVPAPGANAAAGPGLGAKLSYIWQVFLPRLPFMHDDFAPGIQPFWTIYILRAWGAFGTLDVNLPHALLVGIAVVLGVTAALALLGLWRERLAARARWAEIVLLVFTFVCVAIFSHLAFVRLEPTAFLQEQGRYLFPALTVPIVAAIAACFGLGRKLAPLGATVLVTSMMLLCGFAQVYVFSAYFT
jgi:4-amino-4-deoxy-L-arabinose transferase-like glycosyltransferase